MLNLLRNFLIKLLALIAIIVVMLSLSLKVTEIHRKYLMNTVSPYIFKITRIMNVDTGGTGFLISHNGKTHIITNKHVCEGVGIHKVLQVNSSVGIFIKSYKVSKIHDLCAINAPAILGEGLEVGSQPFIGQNIYMMGHPFLQPKRLVSGFYFLTEEVLVQKYLESYRMHISSFPGNSGSPILNIYGRVIGVLYAGNSSDALAVPLKDLLIFIESLK